MSIPFLLIIFNFFQRNFILYFFILLCFFLFIFVGLLITANPYLAVNIYPSNQNFWQDYYEPMASLRYFSVLTKNSLCSNSFASTEKYSDGLVHARFCLKKENYILNYLKILDLYPLLERFLIISLFKWDLV